MDRINIIMAVYNGSSYIKEQIDSIISNTFTNWRLFLFDDGSTDASGSIIEPYVDNNKGKIYYIKNPTNKGLVLNFLEGVKDIANYGEITKEDYFMFCDQDDVWLKDKLEKTLRFLKQQMNLKNKLETAVFTDAYVVDKELIIKEASFFQSNKLNTSTLDLNHIMMENRMIGCTVMFNYYIYKRIQKLPKNARYHDWWIALIACSFGSIHFLNEPTLLYRQHGGNMVGDKKFKDYVVKSVTSINKQKKTVLESINQAKEFYEIYKDDLDMKTKQDIKIFMNLYKMSWFKKRQYLLKKGYLKSGLIRNIGLFIII